MSGINEESFLEAYDYFNQSAVQKDGLSSKASSLTIPADYENASSVRQVMSDISTNITSKIEEYVFVFDGFAKSIEKWKEIEKDAQAFADSMGLETVLGEDGESLGIKTEAGVVYLDDFNITINEKGLYYSWNKDGNSNIKTPCDIFVPNVENITGTLIYFTGLGGLTVDNNVRNLKTGNVETSSIVIIPTQCYALNNNQTMFNGLTTGQSIQMAEDAKNIATSLGIDSSNISVYGFSAGGDLAGTLVAKNPTGTFKTAVFASTRYGVDKVSDPNVKVISTIGENDGQNGTDVKQTISDYKETHINDVEQYVIPVSEDVSKVSHTFVTEAGLETDMFGGHNIFDYATISGS